MFGMFKKKRQEAAKRVSKALNKDAMEAFCGGAMLIAAVDGSIDDKEIEKSVQLIKGFQSMAPFGDEINKAIDKFAARLEASFRTGRLEIMREIADIDSDTETKEELICLLLDVCEASEGSEEDEAKELKVVSDIADRLNMSTFFKEQTQ